VKDENKNNKMADKLQITVQSTTKNTRLVYH